MLEPNPALLPTYQLEHLLLNSQSLQNGLYELSKAEVDLSDLAQEMSMKRLDTLGIQVNKKITNHHVVKRGLGGKGLGIWKSKKKVKPKKKKKKKKTIYKCASSWSGLFAIFTFLTLNINIMTTFNFNLMVTLMLNLGGLSVTNTNNNMNTNVSAKILTGSPKSKFANSNGYNP